MQAHEVLDYKEDVEDLYQQASERSAARGKG